LRRWAALAAVSVLAFVFVPAAPAEVTGPPLYDQQGHLIQTPFAPPQEKPHLTEERATKLFLAHANIADWLKRYPTKDRVIQATFDGTYHDWTVNVWWKEAGEIATGRVDDVTGTVAEAWAGPQVAWKMARGGPGAFGGKHINDPAVWLAFCAVFLLGLGDLRRILSLRNLDLFALLFFSVSLWYFNKGNVFTSVPLAYPPMAYLLGRMLWIGIKGRPVRASRPVWPVWVLIAATIFLFGFRMVLNIRESNVIDVGYSGVIGAQRIADGVSPYGNFPIEENLKPCGPADREGEIRDRLQKNGRCESANPQGDTYGPVAYETYLPGYAILGWSGHWDDLPAAHFTAILFDLLAIIGLALVGRRFGGARLGAMLALAWTAYPFTQYVSNSNTNDAIMPAFLIWGFWLVSSPWARGIFAALAGWTKFAALLIAPLWATYPELRGGSRRLAAYCLAFIITSVLVFSILFFDPHPLDAFRTFWHRTVGWQVGRGSVFSIWDWKQYHASGIPDLHQVQRALQIWLLIGAAILPFFPRRKSPLQLAALTAVLLIGFEFVLTHWFYLYLPWFFPFVAFAVLAAVPAPAPVEVTERHEREPRELVPAG
jgi:hypothetical protein